MDLEIPEGLTGRRRRINWQSGVSFRRGRGQSHNDTIITMATGDRAGEGGGRGGEPYYFDEHYGGL